MMRLKCEVSILNREKISSADLLPVYTDAVIFLYNTSYKPAAVLTVCSENNPTGIKYILRNNVEHVYNRNRDGTATICLKVPALDIYVQKTFQEELFQILVAIDLIDQGINQHKAIITIENPLKRMFCGLHLTTDFTIPTSITIKHRRDFQKHFPLPLSLKTFGASECDLRRVDPRVFRLRNLTWLDLSRNDIEILPDELGNFQHLEKLILRGNKITKVSATLFEHPSGLVKSLKILDLSQNALKCVPRSMSNCSNLIELHMNNNQLECFDLTYDNFPKLRTVMLFNNQLKHIDESFSQLKLLEAHLFLNPWKDGSPRVPLSGSFITLRELAARCVRNNKLDTKELPPLMKRYLSYGRTCKCGNSCFQYCWQHTRSRNISEVCPRHAIDKTSNDHTVTYKVTCCSSRCFPFARRNHYYVTPRLLIARLLRQMPGGVHEMHVDEEIAGY